MKFSVGSKFHLESECNRYVICRAAIQGRAAYSAWYGDTCLGQRSNTTDAKRLCVDHARRQRAGLATIALTA